MPKGTAFAKNVARGRVRRIGSRRLACWRFRYLRLARRSKPRTVAAGAASEVRTHGGANGCFEPDAVQMTRPVLTRCSLRMGVRRGETQPTRPTPPDRAVATGPAPRGPKPLAALLPFASGMFLRVLLPLACRELPVPPHRAFMVLFGLRPLPASL